MELLALEKESVQAITTLPQVLVFFPTSVLVAQRKIGGICAFPLNLLFTFVKAAFTQFAIPKSSLKSNVLILKFFFANSIASSIDWAGEKLICSANFAGKNSFRFKNIDEIKRAPTPEQVSPIINFL